MGKFRNQDAGCPEYCNDFSGADDGDDSGTAGQFDLVRLTRRSYLLSKLPRSPFIQVTLFAPYNLWTLSICFELWTFATELDLWKEISESGHIPVGLVDSWVVTPLPSQNGC